MHFFKQIQIFKGFMNNSCLRSATFKKKMHFLFKKCAVHAFEGVIFMEDEFGNDVHKLSVNMIKLENMTTINRFPYSFR